MRSIGLLILLLITSAIHAQDNNSEMKTLFSGSSGVGGFLGLQTKVTKMNNSHALLTGGGINLVLGSSVNIGFEGYGLATSVLGNRLDTAGNQYNMYLGYGGVNFEPVLASNSMIHVTFPVLLGVGGIGYSNRHFWTEEPDGDINIDFDHDVRSGRVFLIAEPGANLELNVFKWMRLTGGASYRFTEQLESNNLPKEDLDGLSFNIGVRFGWF